MAAIEVTWAGGEHRFLLKIAQLRALQQRCDAGPEWILNRLRTRTWLVDDVIQTIRLGLEGAGMEKDEARRMATVHVENGAIAESVLAAQLILMAAIYSPAHDPVGEAQGEAVRPSQTSPKNNGDSPASTGQESSSA